MKLIIFDVDGTLSPQRLSSTERFSRILLPNVKEKLTVLKQQGVALAIATNQGGVNSQGEQRLSIGDVLSYVCWLKHTLKLDAARFACRGQRKKPNPAMLSELMEQFGVAPSETLFVGDSEIDQQAAQAAHVHFIYANVFFSDP